jgi:ABC-type ATPase involved in cell division
MYPALGVMADIGAAGLCGVALYGSAQIVKHKVNLILPGQQTWRDWCQHLRVQGMPGSGKSTLLIHLAIAQMKAGKGLIVLDPHGSLAKAILQLVPPEKRPLTVYHAPAVVPLGCNVLRLATGGEQEKAEVIDAFLALLKHLTAGWGVVQDAKLEECLWQVIERPNPSLNTLLRVVEATQDKGLYARVSRLIASPTLAKAMELPPVPLEKLMAEGGVYILDLSQLGERTADIFYRLHTVRVLQAAWARGEHSKGVLLICDEAQRARRSSEALERMLAECRKFGVSVVLAHHTNHQLGDGVTEMYNLLGTQYLFRMSPKDARDAQYIASPIEWERLTKLPNYTCLRRRQLHGNPEHPRIIRTKKPPTPTVSIEDARTIARRSAELYGTPHDTGRKPATVSRQTPSSNAQPATGEMVSKLPDSQKTPPPTPSVRLPKEIQPADGGTSGEGLGDSLLFE